MNLDRCDLFTAAPESALNFIVVQNGAPIDWSIGQRHTWGQIDGVLDMIVLRNPCGGGEDDLILLHDLVHLYLSCGGALFGGRGHHLLLSLRAYHQENKFPSFVNELNTSFCSNQRDGSRWCYLWYLVQLISQSNNNNMGP